MGIRPSLKLICGLDDVKVKNYVPHDPRINNARFEERWDTEFDLAAVPTGMRHLFANHRGNRETPLTVGDVIQHDAEFGKAGVVGHIWDSLYANDMLYALAACIPRFQKSGRILLATTPEAEDTSSPNWELQTLKRRLAEGKQIPRDELRGILRRTHSKRLLLKFNHNYHSFSHDFEWKHRASLHALQTAGVSVGRRDLKLMLYWQWS